MQEEYLERCMRGHRRFNREMGNLANPGIDCSIKKPKTHRYPSLKGTDPKFRRNHRHALHGTMRALVGMPYMPSFEVALTVEQKEVKDGKRDAA